MASRTLNDTSKLSIEADSIPTGSIKGPLGTSVIVWNAILLTIATLSTAVRLWSRKKAIKEKFRMEDWLIITAISLSAISTFCSIWGTKYGMGRHWWLMPASLPNTNPFPQYLLINSIVHLIALNLTKISITLYFLRALPGLYLRRASQGLIIFAIASTTSIAFALLFSCSPVSAAWDVTVTDAKCIDESAVAISNAFFDLLSILVIFILPLPILWKAGVPLIQRVPIIFAFFTGLLVITGSIIRITSLFSHRDDKDIHYADAIVHITSTIVLNLAIFCANLPPCKAMLSKHFPAKFPSTTMHLHLTVSNATSLNRFEHKPVKLAPIQTKLKHYHARGGSATSASTHATTLKGWEGRTSCDLMTSKLRPLERSESRECIVVTGEDGVEKIEVVDDRARSRAGSGSSRVDVFDDIELGRVPLGAEKPSAEERGRFGL